MPTSVGDVSVSGVVSLLMLLLLLLLQQHTNGNAVAAFDLVAALVLFLLLRG